MKRTLVVSLALALVACGETRSDVMQGYGEADYLYLSSQESGVIGELYVREGDIVAARGHGFLLGPRRLTYRPATTAGRRCSRCFARE